MRSDKSRVSKSRASSPDGRGVTPPISEPFPINPQTSASPNAGQPLAMQKRVRQTIITQQHSVQLPFFRNAGLSAELCRLEERDSSAVRGAAEIFANYELKVPYYFGMERMCALATNNVEELLSLAAALYEGMKAKQVLRRQTQPQLLPREQEKRLREAAGRKRDFIPRSHTEGTRAQRLLDSIGVFCRERTFLINAPYAPGVTGVRLSNSEIAKLKKVAKTT